MEDEPRTLRDVLRDREAELGISVTEAARLTELPLRQYQKYRNDDVVPQGPSLKRLGKGLDLSTRVLRDAVSLTEAEREAEEHYEKWMAEPASREEVERVENKLFDLEKQLREIRAVLERLL